MEELFFMRIGTLRLRQRWLDREVSPSLTGAAVVGIAAAGLVAGFMASRVLDVLAVAVPNVW